MAHEGVSKKPLQALIIYTVYSSASVFLCVKKQQFFRTITPTLTPTPNPFLGRGEPRHARGGGEVPSQGVEFASVREDRGVQPLRIVQTSLRPGAGWVNIASLH
jgi:hypothetical protein